MDISMLLLFKNWATLMLTAKYVVKRNDLTIKDLKCRGVACIFCKRKKGQLNDKSKHTYAVKNCVIHKV